MDAVSYSTILLDKVCNMLLLITIQQVDERNLNHGVTTWALAHCSTCATYKHLRCECRVIDSHIELEQLVLCGSRYALACEVDTMTHIEQVVNRWYESDMCLVIDEVWIGLDGSSHLSEVIALLKLNVNHTAMDARTHRDCH